MSARNSTRAKLTVSGWGLILVPAPSRREITMLTLVGAVPVIGWDRRWGEEEGAEGKGSCGSGSYQDGKGVNGTSYRSSMEL